MTTKTYYKKRSEDLLNSKDVSITNPRIILLSLLIKAGKPLTVEQILALAKGDLAQSTLYRVLNDLSGFGILTEFRTPENTIVVELNDQESDHHHHIFCESCGGITDISLSDAVEKAIEEEVKRIQKNLNVSISAHALELYGTCQGSCTVCK
tara:strand:+ start:63 stop:518 length:456 start_codon:yes stop_codon:yes gene_type:complete